MDLKRNPLEAAGWAILGLLLLLTLIGAVRLDRSHHPLLGDEATYAMQAASLAWDFDLAYTRQDYDRFVTHWGVPPQGLVLQSRPGSAKLVYAKPPLYALILAPFVRLAPVRGPVVANALLLAAAVLLAALALRRRIGRAAPYWTAAFVFASVAFAYVFWGDADLFLMACTAAGFALVYWEDRRYLKGDEPPPEVYQGEDTAPERHSFARWCGAGALLGVAAVTRPFYLTLFLPAVVAAWGAHVERRRAALAGLLLGAAGIAAISFGIQWLAGGDPTAYGGQRQGTYGSQGYPEVEYPAARWSAQVEKHGNASWLQESALRPRFSLALTGWNLVYLLFGRNVGILPYFLPLLLGFVAFQRDRGRWAIPLAVGASVLAFVFLLPFNFYGGGALGNRYFLPLYPALWFLAARPVRAAWAPLVVLLASPFVGPLWKEPTGYPVGDDGQPLYASSAVARRWLPFETTQSNLPGDQVALGGGLWVKLLNHNAWHSGRGMSLKIAGGAPVEMLLASPQPLDSVDFELDDNAPTRLQMGDRELRPLMFLANGSEIFEVRLWKERAVHPLWWGPYDYHLYALSFHLPGAKTTPASLHIRPSRNLIEPHRSERDGE
ncbi:MAG TPA: glycosyltransferase 87 family protein [Thermoanaerobaculia bacterium]|nr:glycosyltransferase 87 family protein [Thermoanaerobaculia bacterium]